MIDQRSLVRSWPDVSPERERVATAAINLILQRGYDATTVEAILMRAGVSRKEFDHYFRDKEDCVLKVLDGGVERFAATVFGSYKHPGVWRDRLRAAAYAAAGWVRENPRYLRFATLMMDGATDLARTHRDMALQMFTVILDDGRKELDDPDAISSTTALTVIGSIYQLLLRQISRSATTDTAEDFVPGLMYVAVRPYLGHAAALEELSIPPPTQSREWGRPASQPKSRVQA